MEVYRLEINHLKSSFWPLLSKHLPYYLVLVFLEMKKSE